MTVFAILMPAPRPNIVARIKSEFPDDYLQITETQYLVSSDKSVTHVTAILKIAGKDIPKEEIAGTAIVFTTSSYYGRAPSIVWDWLKTKIEKNSNG